MSGMRDRNPFVNRSVRIESVCFVAEHDCHVPVDGYRGDITRSRRSVRSGTEYPESFSRKFLDLVIDEDGQMKRCSRSSSQRFRIERVNRACRTHHGAGTEGFSGADQRAEVPGITQTIDDEHPTSQVDAGKVSTRNFSHDALWRFRGGDPLQHAILQLVNDDVAKVDSSKRSIRPFRIDEHLEHVPLCAQRFFQEMPTFDDEALGLIAFGFVREQTTKPLHPIVAEPETGVAQTRAPRAVSTSLVNAAGSLTARSARILRST